MREIKPSGGSSAFKIFIGGLHPDTTEKDLEDFFSRFDSIEDALVMRDKSRDNVSRGFAFVSFKTQQGMERACEERFLELMNRRVICSSHCYYINSIHALFHYLDRSKASNPENSAGPSSKI